MSMKQPSQIFHGEWWVPAVKDHNVCMFAFRPEQMMGQEKKYTGTLTYYEDEDSTLELYHVPSNYRSKQYCQNEVMWGADANGNIFTLFDIEMKENLTGDFTTTKFEVGLILVGEHILSLDDAQFNRCVVHFTYLRNWAFRNNLTIEIEGDCLHHVLAKPSMGDALLKAQVENDVNWILFDDIAQNKTRYDLSISQGTNFVVESSEDASIRSYMNHIVEFSQFLSIALYCEQNPSAVSFYNKLTNHSSFLLFEKGDSTKPKSSSLIKFKELKDKIPAMFRAWHENFTNVSPISKYLVDSLRKTKTFDAPDFLIIAQALDGYHKRFVNKKNGGKDHRKYEDGIKILLKQFKDVDYVRDCHIDPIVLKDSRDKYSHLLPDDEKKRAVEGEDLYWLTEKCKILLTCCILNMMGLSNEEINICFRCSPIQEFIVSHMFDFYYGTGRGM